MVHVNLMCVELDRTWTSVEPHGGAKRPTSENRTSKASSSNNFMIDSTSTTYHLSHSAQMDHHLLPTSSPAGDFESAQPYIPDGCCPNSTTPHERCARPLCSTTLVRVPGDAGFMSIAMLHLYQLHAARWLRANPILPFHLGALEIMDRALRGSFSPKA